MKGEGNGTPLWYSCLENPMDRGSSSVEKSRLSLGTKAASIKVNTSLAWRACLPFLPALPAENSLFLGTRG